MVRARIRLDRHIRTCLAQQPLPRRCISALVPDQARHRTVRHPSDTQLQREPGRDERARSNRLGQGRHEMRRSQDPPQRNAWRDAFRQAVDHDDMVRRQGGHRRRVVDEERIDVVFDADDIQLTERPGQLLPASHGHRDPERIVERRLYVNRPQRTLTVGGSHAVRSQAVFVDR